jgi:hypothetical protein
MRAPHTFRFGLLILLCLWGLSVQAQAHPEFLTFNADRLQLTRGGMAVLGGWAVGNIGFSGVQYFRTSGSTQYFHQMNVMWNLVNLGLAVPGYLGAAPGSADSLSIAESIRAQYSIEKILLVNAGLDVGYVMTGFFLREKSKTATKRNDMLKGYGNSLLVQGGFLLLFDSVFFILQNRHGNQDLTPILERLSVGPGSIGWTF